MVRADRHQVSRPGTSDFALLGAPIGRLRPRDGLLLAFLALAVCCRVLYWAYTDRVWEDALISLTPARNFWDGLGFTHHPSEPRVHSFTSALGEFVLLIGEGVGQGVNLMRLLSLLAAAAAIRSAARIGEILDLPWYSRVLFLTYLATDHLQVMFGMAGMETQIATALFLSSAWALLTERWTHLGLFLGLALLARWKPVAFRDRAGADQPVCVP